ncbi:helix-turn-helix domain-containing protein [Rhizobium sp. P38BS-XIX]|uniref:helix-turn-helix domain-containing protein n=1 Tax=Rhizobium sp. P38BS-XIX TaxID=2726740 RepID=UPI00145785C3|nr:helix-turn-helix domain-containing protein [Rhizobium sp. P38BS-XIX]NLR98168.1 helix-turn-helix domain-containing protein [Rhizobium sp. P38BS-XIX]
MDSLIVAAAQALAAGDALGAMKRVALRNDAPALALRGIAMAQLGDFDRAKILLKSATRAFGPRETVARARCIVAEAEIALVSRDLGWPEKTLETARATLERRGDHVNAAHARNLQIRRLLLVGHLDEAERLLGGLDPSPLPPAARASHELAVAGIAIRRLRTRQAHTALKRAAEAAQASGIPALVVEVQDAALAMNVPVARMIANGIERPLFLSDVEELLSSETLVVDACRNVVRAGGEIVPLASRPVLFTLARVLAEAAPTDVPRAALILRAFRARYADESHRARLRVEIGRLRAALEMLADIDATSRGFALTARGKRDIVVLAPPVDVEHAALLALLADGEAWSSSALAIALEMSPRTVQRALDALATGGMAQAVGNGRARRWMMPPVVGFPTTLLLPGPLPSD